MRASDCRFFWKDRIETTDATNISSIRIQLPNAKEEEVITIGAESVKTIESTSKVTKKKVSKKKKASRKKK